MITHDKVESEIKFLEWQIAAWERIKERNPTESNFVYFQKQYCEGRIQALKEWDTERWS